MKLPTDCVEEIRWGDPGDTQHSPWLVMTVILTSVVVRSRAGGKDQDPHPQGVEVMEMPREVILSPARLQSNFNTKGGSLAPSQSAQRSLSSRGLARSEGCPTASSQPSDPRTRADIPGRIKASEEKRG